MNSCRNWLKRYLPVVGMVLVCLSMIGCDDSSRNGELMTGGDAGKGRGLIVKYGCNACHVIDSIPGAIGQVGPPLTNIKQRSYIAGVLSNTPANLQRWIMNPTEISPKTAMPDLDVTEQDARDIAAFLYSQ